MNYDRSEDKSIEEKLELSEERFRIFVKHTPAAVAMFDQDMHYLAVSDRWLKDYNITDEQVIGKSHYEIFPDISDEWVEIYQICLTGITKKGEDTIVTTRGKEEWVEWEIHPWYKSSGEVGGIIIYADVITKRKNTEMELLRARERAEEASRAKSAFIANMSHEFRTPLNAILGYAQIMQNSDELSTEQQDFVEEIISGGVQLLAMINDIIDLSKIETSKIDYKEVSFPIDQLVKDVVDPFINKFQKKGIGLEASILEGTPKKLSTDFRKVESILQQLLNNALKFTHSGTVKITVDFEGVEYSSGANGKLFIIVSDSGIGIAEDKMDLIFKPFAKVNPESNGGTGLGLTLVKRLTRFLGGKVDVTSKQGEGSDFRVIVPIKASQQLYSDDQTFSFLEEQSLNNENLTPADVSNYISSLSDRNRNLVKEAIEFQDLERLSKLEEYINAYTRSELNYLKRLEKSAQDLDYMFLKEVHNRL